MAINHLVAALLIGLLVWLGALYFCSRRCPPVVLLLISVFLGASGAAAWLLWAGPAGRLSVVVSAMGAIAAGGFGALLAGIDCIRKEGWRREGTQSIETPEPVARRD
jgi:hypothetical protein